MEESNAVKVVEEKVNNAVAESSSIEIKTDEDLSRATTMLANIKKLAKFIEQEKKKITDPQRAALEAARDLFRPFEDGADKAESELKQKVITYQLAKDKAAKAEEAKIAKAVETGRFKEETGIRKLENVAQVEKKVATSAGSATMTYSKKVGKIDEAILPDEYWAVDLVKIGKVIRAGGTIAGVEVISVPNVAVSAAE